MRLPTHTTLPVLIVSTLLGCVGGGSKPAAAVPSPNASAPSSGGSPVPAVVTPDPSCGMGTHDWCPAPADDPCGAHKDVASCRADERCVGMRYRGESFVACRFDGRGFATNCPTVGCMSNPR